MASVLENSGMFDRLNNVNYRTWAFKMRMFLIKEDLWDMIEKSWLLGHLQMRNENMKKLYR